MRSRTLRLAALVVLACGLTAACGKYSISNIRSLKAFSDANGLYKKGEYKNAIARYEDAVRLNPEQGLVYFFLGHSNDMLWKAGKKGQPENDAYMQKAVENYRLAIDKLANSTEPKAAEVRKLAYEYLIQAYGPEKLADFSQAEPIAKQLLAMDTNDPVNYQYLGTLYEGQGRYAEAEAQFKKAIELRPNDAAGYAVLAGFYNRQGEFEKTMQAWNDRANKEPNNPAAWQTIATFYWEKVFRDKTLRVAKAKEYTQLGLEAVDKALALNSEYYEANSFKNILMKQMAAYVPDLKQRQKLLDDSEVYYKKALELQKKQNEGGGQTPAGKGK
jgi:tetratricopeptide (TPR) repeat protein